MLNIGSDGIERCCGTRAGQDCSQTNQTSFRPFPQGFAWQSKYSHCIQSFTAQKNPPQLLLQVQHPETAMGGKDQAPPLQVSNQIPQCRASSPLLSQQLHKNLDLQAWQLLPRLLSSKDNYFHGLQHPKKIPFTLTSPIIFSQGKEKQEWWGTGEKKECSEFSEVNFSITELHDGMPQSSKTIPVIQMEKEQQKGSEPSETASDTR